MTQGPKCWVLGNPIKENDNQKMRLEIMTVKRGIKMRQENDTHTKKRKKKARNGGI